VADNPYWPDSLPQTPYSSADGTPQYDPADNLIRTSVSMGPAKQRRRFTAVPETVKLQMWLTSDQVTTLRSFIADDLQDALPFTWIDFRDGSQCDYRFTKGQGSISYKFDSGDIWIVSIEMERLP
jgi:hypothetical protein